MINSWHDLYQQLWMQSAESRGLRAATGAQPRTSRMPEWPRTTHADIADIIAVVDPIIDGISGTHGSHGTRRLWQTMVVELEAELMRHRDDEYFRSEDFWSVLLVVFAYLEVSGAILPDVEECELLLTRLWLPSGRRNASGATHVISESSDEKMWDGQQAEMIKRYGFDVREPTAGMMGRPMKVPRTTNAEAVGIADYWTKQLQAFIVKTVLGDTTNSMGLDGQSKRWSAVLDDIEHLARAGKPDEVYAKNHELWREALGLATNLSVWGEVPSPYDLQQQAIDQAWADLPDRLAKATGAVARAIGNVAHEAGAGLLSPLAKPLLIGGGVALGLILLLRRSPAESTHPAT
jgi:hypothetical protein